MFTDTIKRTQGFKNAQPSQTTEVIILINQSFARSSRGQGQLK